MKIVVVDFYNRCERSDCTESEKLYNVLYTKDTLQEHTLCKAHVKEFIENKKKENPEIKVRIYPSDLEEYLGYKQS